MARYDGSKNSVPNTLTFNVSAFRNLALSLLILAFTSGAHAWGEQGHRITGLVAERLLTADARVAIRGLMGHTDLGAFSLHLDKQKDALDKRMPGSRQWHYDDRPVCNSTAPRISYCSNDNCASTQITRHYRALIDPHSTRSEKQFAIYVLTHLVGDVHQPLHASDHEDRGGNDIRVSYKVGAQQRKSNLHSAWDTDFVRLTFTSSDERVIAQQLVEAYGVSKVAEWQHGSVAKWLQESYALSGKLAYGSLPDWRCAAEDFGLDRVELSEDYVTRAKEAIPELLAKGGFRIAYLLNRAFSK